MTTVHVARTLLVLAALAAFALVVLALGPLRRIPTLDVLAPGAGEAPGGAARGHSPGDGADTRTQPHAVAPPPAGAALRGEAASDKQALEKAPAFDVVRVEPNGDTVIGGRAGPGSTVELLVDGLVKDRVVADGSGLFAMTPPRLGKGEHELSLRFTAPDGKQVLSRQAVSVSLDLAKPPLVALSAPDQPTIVLSGAAAGLPATTAPGAVGMGVTAMGDTSRPSIAVATVEADRAGKLFVSGTTAPGATVRLYLDDAYLASTTAGPDGRVAFTIASGMRPGSYRVRLDDVDPVNGAVKGRAEVPFAAPADIGSARVATAKVPRLPVPGEPATADAAGTAGRTVVVAQGDTLWHISRRTYGLGGRYTIVYKANQGQIRDPDLIYPGQTFVLPDKRS